MKRKFSLVLVALILLLTSCNGAGNSTGVQDLERETVKLGASIPQTGPVSIYGITAENGVKLAIDEINAAGGINGKQVEWVSYDDKGEITDAVTNYNKLMQDGVDAVFGGITSKPTLAMAESSVKDGVVFITPTGTQSNITEGKPNVFRVAFNDPFQGKVLANFSKNDLNAKKVAVLRNQSSDFSMGVADYFNEETKSLGMEIVADEAYGDNDTDFKAQLTNIKGKNPDILLIPDYYEKVALIVLQVRQAGINATILGADGWDTVLSVLDKSNYKDIDGSYFCNQFSLDDPDEKVQTFIKAYKEKYNEDPSTFAAEGYDTVYLYKQAAEQAGTTKYEDVIAALDTLEFSGITGTFKYDENNNPVKSAKMIRIENGEYKFDSVAKVNN